MQRDPKYDRELTKEALVWLKKIVGEEYGVPISVDEQDTITEALKDGQYLCKAINIIEPSSDGSKKTHNQHTQTLHTGKRARPQT